MEQGEIMELVISGLLFVVVGLGAWIVCLKTGIEQRDGKIKSTQKEIDWVKQNCPNEWAAIAVKMSHYNEDPR